MRDPGFFKLRVSRFLRSVLFIGPDIRVTNAQQRFQAGFIGQCFIWEKIYFLYLNGFYLVDDTILNGVQYKKTYFCFLEEPVTIGFSLTFWGWLILHFCQKDFYESIYLKIH